jgi:hypothetical protein
VEASTSTTKVLAAAAPAAPEAQARPAAPSADAAKKGAKAEQAWGTQWTSMCELVGQFASANPAVSGKPAGQGTKVINTVCTRSMYQYVLVLNFFCLKMRCNYDKHGVYPYVHQWTKVPDAEQKALISMYSTVCTLMYFDISPCTRIEFSFDPTVYRGTYLHRIVFQVQTSMYLLVLTCTSIWRYVLICYIQVYVGISMFGTIELNAQLPSTCLYMVFSSRCTGAQMSDHITSKPLYSKKITTLF